MPIDIELLHRKAAQLERALTRVRTKLDKNLSAFRPNYDAQDIVFRNFQIAVQNCVDIASHILVEKGMPSPATMAQTFDILRIHRVLEPRTAQMLKKMVALRNILVHDYAPMDFKKAHLLILQSLTIIPAFCRRVIKR